MAKVVRQFQWDITVEAVGKRKFYSVENDRRVVRSGEEESRSLGREEKERRAKFQRKWPDTEEATRFMCSCTVIGLGFAGG